MMLRGSNHTTTIAQRVLRALLLVQLLPTLLLTPSEASAVLLHSHLDQAHHFHLLSGVEFATWAEAQAAEHDRATEESDVCCETRESPAAPDGIVLQRPAMLVCRVRSADAAAGSAAGRRPAVPMFGRNPFQQPRPAYLIPA